MVAEVFKKWMGLLESEAHYDFVYLGIKMPDIGDVKGGHYVMDGNL